MVAIAIPENESVPEMHVLEELRLLHVRIFSQPNSAYLSPELKLEVTYALERACAAGFHEIEGAVDLRKSKVDPIHSVWPATLIQCLRERVR